MSNNRITIHSKRYAWLSLLGIGCAIAVLNLDMSIVNLLLPSIGRQFHSSLNGLQWVNISYSIALACSFCVAGRYGDSYGSKRTFLFGVATFLIGSTVCGLAPNMPLLMSGRIIQGIGMSATFTMCFILIHHLFPKKQHALVISLLTIFTGLNQAMGPTVGGMIVTFWSWHWAFLINIPVCILSYVLVWRYAHINFVHKALKLDYISVTLLSITLFGIIYILNQSTGSHLLTWSMLGWMGLSIFSLIYLIIRQKHINNPIISLKLYTINPWLRLNIMRALFQLSFAATGFIIPLFFQNYQWIIF